MIHEIFPDSISNQFHANPQIDNDDYVLYYESNSILLKKHGQGYSLPKATDIHTTDTNRAFRHLFGLNNQQCFWLESYTDVNPELELTDITQLRTLPNKGIAWAGAIGFQLQNWYRANKFCGKCGSPTEHKADERAIVCPKCENIVFPKISPAIIVAITCKDKILLAKGKHYKGDFYALIAGYVDSGETLEETVVREVKEEIGLSVKNIRYYKSQPWPFTGSLMIGFFAEGDDTEPICLDTNEISEAQWFTRQNMPFHASSASISGSLIEAWIDGSYANY